MDKRSALKADTREVTEDENILASLKRIHEEDILKTEKRKKKYLEEF